MQVYTPHFKIPPQTFYIHHGPLFMYCRYKNTVAKTSYGKHITFHGVTKHVSLYFVKHLPHLKLSQPIPVAARSKAWVCCRSLRGTAGSNSPRGMDVCLLWVLCVRKTSLRRADHSSRGVLSTVVCLSASVVLKPRQFKFWVEPRNVLTKQTLITHH